MPLWTQIISMTIDRERVTVCILDQETTVKSKWKPTSKNLHFSKFGKSGIVTGNLG